MTFSPLKESNAVQKTQRIINFLKIYFSLFCLCVESSQNTETEFCFKNTFWYMRGPGRMETEATQIWRIFENMRRWKQESFWKGTLCNWAWHVFTDISKLQAPQSCKQYNGTLCSDPHSGPRVCYSCIWYCTLESQRASMIIERKHKD